MEACAAIHDYPRMAKAPRASLDEIAERLVLLRKAVSGDGRGAQTAFCVLTGLATNAWNNLEKGTNRISVDTALVLSRRLGVSLDWIYQGEQYERYLPGDLIEKIRRARAEESAPAEEKA